jgi:hypothetical protein
VEADKGNHNSKIAGGCGEGLAAGLVGDEG